MNIFATSPDPVACAAALADRHVVKMAVETAQILSTALHLRGEATAGLYQPTHTTNPTVRWAAASPEELGWTLDHGLALLNEYHWRYPKPAGAPAHKSSTVYDILTGLIAGGAGQPASFVFVGPEMFGGADVHLAYRDYLGAKYVEWAAKARAHVSRKCALKWTRRQPPNWYTDRVQHLT